MTEVTTRMCAQSGISVTGNLIPCSGLTRSETERGLKSPVTEIPKFSRREVQQGRFANRPCSNSLPQKCSLNAIWMRRGSLASKTWLKSVLVMLFEEPPLPGAMGLV